MAVKQQAVTKGSIGWLNDNSNDLTFQFNPTTVQRSRRATYAKNQAAYADFPNSGKGYPALEWIRNEAEDIQVELMFHERGDRDVETQLRKLDDMMKPNPSTGEPRDCVLAMGHRYDRVRILEKMVTEKLYKPDLKVQQATVSLRMTALRSRTK